MTNRIETIENLLTLITNELQHLKKDEAKKKKGQVLDDSELKDITKKFFLNKAKKQS